MRLIFLLFILPSFLFSQTLLTHGTLPLSEKGIQVEASFPSGYYILQFRHPVSENQKFQLSEHGVSFFGYLPKFSFLVYVNRSISGAQLNFSGVAGIVPYQPEWRFAPHMPLTPPPHAIPSPGIAAIWIQTFPNVEPDRAIAFFTEKGALSINKLPYGPEYHIELPLASLNLQEIPQWIQSFQWIPAPGEPENLQGAANHRSSYLHNPGLGTPLLGSGVKILLNDDGLVSPHIDFHQRMQNITAGNGGSHGDHCAGIIAGAGNLEPRAQGNAPGAWLTVRNYTHSSSSGQGFFSYPASYTSDTLVISSNSYGDGCNSGYNSLALYLDQSTLNHRGLSHVFSAGNSGTSNCNYGAGSNWGNITGGTKIGKNVLAVGNILKTNTLANSSSRGPATDGRIKPNVCAVGTDVYSTYENATQYANATGTSMACPGVAGVLGLLHEGYRSINQGEIPPSELLHGILMNTADDMGNPGPDFRFGFGRVNARRAWSVLQQQQYLNDTIQQSQTKTFNLQVPPNLHSLNLMLYWHDTPAQIQAARALVNDLDVSLSDPLGNTFQPWVLNPAPNATTLNQNASRARDSLNNMEQITLANPLPGNYVIQVSGFNIPSGSQSFHLNWEFEPISLLWAYPSGGESFVPGSAEHLYWDYSGPQGTFAISYSADQGNTWTSINNAVNAATRHLVWTPPTQLSGSNLLFRIQRDTLTFITPQAVSVMPIPTGLQTDTICPYSVKLKWNAVAGAASYDIFRLGSHYMDSVGTTSATEFTPLPLNTSSANWFSVRARSASGAMSRRARAIQQSPGSGPCIPVYDMAIGNPNFPFVPETPSCFNQLPLSVRIQNKSWVDFNNFNLYVSINGNTPMVESFNGVLPFMSDSLFTFQTALPTSPGPHQISIWHDVAIDNTLHNDTLHFTFNWSASTSFPWSENFANANPCSLSQCASNSCNPNQGMTNIRLNNHEQSDWIIHQGAGPGNQPMAAYSGNHYALLPNTECPETFAFLHTPCISLAGAQRPYLSFAHFIPQNANAKIHVDVFSQGNWHLNIVPEITGTSNFWKRDTVDLSQFSGEDILIRLRGFSGNNNSVGAAIDALEIREIRAGFQEQDTLCAGIPTHFVNQATGFLTSMTWQFSPNANPNTINALIGPSVTFSTRGTATASQTLTGHDTSITLIKTLSIDSFPEPTIQFSHNGNNNYTFQIPNANGSLVSWVFSDGYQTTGNPISHTFNPTSYPETFSVQVTQQNACGLDSSMRMLTLLGTNTIKTPLYLYPNPASDVINLNWDPSLQVTALKILDATGRTLANPSVEGNSGGKITLQLPNGFYNILIEATNSMHVLPLIILTH
jgi:hypothetical protein